MKRIRNVQKAGMRLGELIRLHADAIKNHRPSEDIYREMVRVRCEILDWELRQDRRAA